MGLFGKINIKKLICFFVVLIAAVSGLCIMLSSQSDSGHYVFLPAKAESLLYSNANNSFSWDNATIYSLVTDRFLNGDTSNDNSYNRGLNLDGTVASSIDQSATFHGGDFAGIITKIEDGYFDSLGVNVINISAPFEQIHGYIPGGINNINFPKYAYDGDSVLDYTLTDANFGTANEFKSLVDKAHEHGIRVVIDVDLSSPGTFSMYDMNEYEFGSLKTGWDKYYYSFSSFTDSTYSGYIDISDSSSWSKWWTNIWVNVSPAIGGYTSSPLLSGKRYYAPSFITSSKSPVGVPNILVTKWRKEGRFDKENTRLNDYFNKTKKVRTVSNYIIFWISSWVEEYGIDGINCSSPSIVNMSIWNNLKTSCKSSYAAWMKNNHSKVLKDSSFWMNGNVKNRSISKDSYYTAGTFDSMHNYDIKAGNKLDTSQIGKTYNSYSSLISSDSSFNVMSFLSSADTSLSRSNTTYLGSALLLMPGAVSIYYGDESNRLVDYSLQTQNNYHLNSDMNWNSIDSNNMLHWKKVSTFRNNHKSIGAGTNNSLYSTSGYAFSRIYKDDESVDKIVACIGITSDINVSIDVSNLWADGTTLVNAYDDTTAVVYDGMISFSSGQNGTILVEEQPKRPLICVVGNNSFYGTQYVTVHLTNAEYAKLSIDNSDKIIVKDNDVISIGDTAYEGNKISLVFEAYNDHSATRSTFTFYKSFYEEKVDNSTLAEADGINKTINIHIKAYEGTKPYLYAWNDQDGKDAILSSSFPGNKLEHPDKDGWYNCTINNYTSCNAIISLGDNSTQSDDITNLSDDVWITMLSKDCKLYSLGRTASATIKNLKTRARKFKILKSTDFTLENWDSVNGVLNEVDKVIAANKPSAFSNIASVLEKIDKVSSTLYLTDPIIVSAASSDTIVKGVSPYSCNITVNINGHTYSTISDDLSGQWSVNVDTLNAGDEIIIKETKLGYSNKDYKYIVK